MATKIKIITASDFIEVTPDGMMNLEASRQLLIDIAKADPAPADYELLVDFRNTQSDLSLVDLYNLSEELIRHGNTFHRKVALLVLPGVNFDRAHFFETCSFNRGFSINAYMDYESAIRWLNLAENQPDSNVPPGDLSS
jgi:hypothetical protein